MRYSSLSVIGLTWWEFCPAWRSCMTCIVGGPRPADLDKLQLWTLSFNLVWLVLHLSIPLVCLPTSLLPICSLYSVSKTWYHLFSTSIASCSQSCGYDLCYKKPRCIHIVQPDIFRGHGQNIYFSDNGSCSLRRGDFTLTHSPPPKTQYVIV